MNKIVDFSLLQKIVKKLNTNIFVIIGLLGIVLLSIGGGQDKVKDRPKEQRYSTEKYKRDLERQMGDILSCIEGAGEVEIMITLESDWENVYAWQEKSSDDVQTVSADGSRQESKRSSYENQVVTINQGSENTALVEKTLQPAVQGVVVVCRGADDIKVISDITNAVSVALNVPTNRICVIKKQ